MNINLAEAKKASLWKVVLRIKSGLLVFALMGLVTSNVASLVSTSAHDWMHSALRQFLAIGGEAVADRALVHSPKGQRAVVEAKHAQLERRYKSQEVELEHSRLKAQKLDLELGQAMGKLQALDLELGQAKGKAQALRDQLHVSGTKAKETVTKVHKRLAAGISRNLASLPAEAIPWFGIAAAISMTVWDIKDACETSKDFNTLLQAMGQGEDDPDLCGTKFPTRAEVVKKACSNARIPLICAKQAAEGVD